MATTVQELLEQLREHVRELTPAELEAIHTTGGGPAVLDVREHDEYACGCIPGAVHVSRGLLELRVESLLPDRRAPVVVYCGSGVRSLFAAESLLRLGYENVWSVKGGFARWAAEGRRSTTPQVLSLADRRRYKRHFTIPEVGEAGQLKLRAARVLLIGAGGLGCPAALYLAAAGVGTIGLVDFDQIDETNLQRQILYSADKVGLPKVETAAVVLRAQNPQVCIVPIEQRLTRDNVEAIVRDFDLVIDGSDNFPTRYLVNDACVLLRKPCVHGSVYRFEGQVSVFYPPDGPCYRCLYPEPPPADLAPSCAEAGVLGAVPGVIGLLEALEAMKIILGIGAPLVGQLLQYDALRADFHKVTLRRNPACAYCSDGGVFPGFVDYEGFCQASA
jgi:molybdopterin/thiamine biosynthesis adenylyltransferase/rhodanese-related sulfurtransferase